MAQEYKGSEELLARTGNFLETHLDLYLSSGGTQGHIMNYSHVGIDGFLPALLLETIGRKSGKRYITPLIYGCYGGEWIVIGSKGGAPDHPAWFLNLEQQDGAIVQIGTEAFRSKWRLVEGDERDAIWDYMVGMFPNYADYKTAVTRTIPVVALKLIDPRPVLKRP